MLRTADTTASWEMPVPVASDGLWWKREGYLRQGNQKLKATAKSTMPSAFTPTGHRAKEYPKALTFGPAITAMRAVRASGRMEAPQELHAEDGEADRAGGRQHGVGYELLTGHADQSGEHVPRYHRPRLGKLAERDNEEQKRCGAHGQDNKRLGGRPGKMAAQSDHEADRQKSAHTCDDLFLPSGLVPLDAQPCFDLVHRSARD